jgi:DNA-binding transcriptional ArsR family regulator
MDPFNPKRLVLGTGKAAWAKPRAKEKPPHHKQGEKFLKGPVPLTWLARAAQLPGKALHIGVVLWFLAGLKNTRSVSLPSTALRLFGIDRSAKRRALGWLEEAGLVIVARHPGRNPRVTLLDAKEPQ